MMLMMPARPPTHTSSELSALLLSPSWEAPTVVVGATVGDVQPTMNAAVCSSRALVKPPVTHLSFSPSQPHGAKQFETQMIAAQRSGSEGAVVGASVVGAVVDTVGLDVGLAVGFEVVGLVVGFSPTISPT